MKAILTMLLVGFAALVDLQAALPQDNKPFDLTTELGETYKKCRLIKVTPEAITVVHDGGVAKVPFTLLNAEWRDKYDYSPDKAHAYMMEEERKSLETAELKKKANQERERAEEARMSALVAAEKQQNITSAPLAPMPGDPPVVHNTEVVVPPFNPITQIYTPGVNRSQTYLFQGGNVYAPSSFPAYPTYGPVYPAHGPFCPPVTRSSYGVSGQIFIGPQVIRIQR